MTESSRPQHDAYAQPPALPEEKRRKGGGFAAFLKVLFRLLLLVILGALVGAAFYFGIPLIYRATVVPVQQNTDAIRALTQRVDQAEARIATTSDTLQERTARMEGEITSLQETSSVHAGALATSDERITAAEEQLTGLDEAITAQAETLTALETDLEAAARRITDLGSRFSRQETDLEALETDLAERLELVEAQAELLTGDQEALWSSVALLQAAQDLIRVQLLLLEDNPGAARAGLEVVVAHLTRFAALLPDRAPEAAGLAARVEALDALIEERSFRTAPALEALWADIADMVLPVPEGELPDLSATGLLTATETLTETDTVTVTPTPSP